MDQHHCPGQATGTTALSLQLGTSITCCSSLESANASLAFSMNLFYPGGFVCLLHFPSWFSWEHQGEQA